MKSYFKLNLPLRQDNYIHIYRQKPSSSLIYNKEKQPPNKKVPFYENLLQKLCFRRNFSFTPKTKTIFLLYHVKSEDLCVPEHFDIIKASKNVSEKVLSEHRQ